MAPDGEMSISYYIFYLFITLLAMFVDIFLDMLSGAIMGLAS